MSRVQVALDAALSLSFPVAVGADPHLVGEPGQNGCGQAVTEVEGHVLDDIGRIEVRLIAPRPPSRIGALRGRRCWWQMRHAAIPVSEPRRREGVA